MKTIVRQAVTAVVVVTAFMLLFIFGTLLMHGGEFPPGFWDMPQ